jgi:hypothetical protein
MRKNLLAKSIATLIAGFGVVGGAHAIVVIDAPTAPAAVPAATTLEVNTDAIGHSLLYPYYTVQGDNYTLFSLVNTDMLNGKAVKVRFRGAENSDDVYDITVLLSPGDVWNANITRDANNTATLTTADKSCTLPQNVNQPFVTARLSGSGQTSASTLEGYIEVFNMADIPPNLVAGGVNPLFTAVKHVNGVPPGCTSAATNALFVDPANAAAAEAAGLGAPTTGLTGSWTILNGPAAASWAGEAVAIEAREIDNGRPGYGNIVFFPQSNNQVLLANARQYTADPILRGGVPDNTVAGSGTPTVAPPVQALLFDFPDMSTPYLTNDIPNLANGNAARRQAYRLSRAIAVTSVSNEFITGSGILAKTDWTLSSPSRRYNVARNYTAPGSNLFTNFALDDANAPVTAVPVPGGITVNPTNYYTGGAAGNTTTTFANANSGSTPYGVICVTGTSFAAGLTTNAGLNPNHLISGQILNTEEGAVGATPNQFVVSPGSPTVTRSLCGEVSVVSWNAAAPAGSTILPTSTLNAQLTRFDITSVNAAGWARIATPGLTVASPQGLGVTVAGATSTRNGLPIIGHSFVQFTNNNATQGANGGGADARTVGNYDQTLKHRATRY